MSSDHRIPKLAWFLLLVTTILIIWATLACFDSNDCVMGLIGCLVVGSCIHLLIIFWPWAAKYYEDETNE